VRRNGTDDDDVDFFNNIIRDAAVFVDVYTPKLSASASDRNLYRHSGGNQRRLRINGTDRTLAEWQALTGVPTSDVLARDPSSMAADPRFVAAAGTTDDYYTERTSPARDAALPNTGARFSGSGPDIGFRGTYADPGS
jgi:hypothetical protein